MTVDRAPAPPVTHAPPPAHHVASWLEVAGQRCDLTARALVLGVGSARSRSDDDRDDERLWGEGADLLEHPSGPALLVSDPVAAAGPEALTSWAETGVTVLLGAAGAGADEGAVAAMLAGRLMVARAAGLDDERLAVDVADRFDEIDLALALGRPVAVSVLVDDAAEAVGLATAAVVRGARIVRTDQVRAVRRAVDVLAAVFEAA